MFGFKKKAKKIERDIRIMTPSEIQASNERMKAQEKKQAKAKAEAAKRVEEIEIEYLKSEIEDVLHQLQGINQAPVQVQQTEAERQMEIYFTMKNDILRYNMSRTATVPTEGNEFD